MKRIQPDTTTLTPELSQRTSPASLERKVIVKIGAEGGSITLFGTRSQRGWAYSMSVDECIDDECSQHETNGVDSWEAALRLLDRYPWHRLSPLEVHPEFRTQIWAVVQRRFECGDEAGVGIENWRQICGETDNAVEQKHSKLSPALPAVLQDSRFMALRLRERRGSRARCILLTDADDAVVAQRLSRLVAPLGVIEPNKHYWMPRGFAAPGEARLGEAAKLLSTKNRELVTDWWLAVRHRKANTPNWDFAATATINGSEGLVLVEAKAHEHELDVNAKRKTKKTNLENHERIDKCCKEASTALNSYLPGWALSATSHYQFCNRFSWAWKLASLGIPVVLVYLGFLDAEEMHDALRSAWDWREIVQAHGKGIVPEAVWDAPIMVGDTPVHAIIRAVKMCPGGILDFIPC
jgi:hypothetical protein